MTASIPCIMDMEELPANGLKTTIRFHPAHLRTILSFIGVRAVPADPRKQEFAGAMYYLERSPALIEDVGLKENA